MRLPPDASTGRRPFKAPARQQGFTLLEILLAVTILGLAYVAILQNFSESMRNIVRVDASRTAVLEDSVAFARKMQPSRYGVEEEGLDEPVFLEGHKHRLVLVTDDKNEYMSLKLESLP